MLQHILYQSQDYPIKDLNPSQFKVEELLIKEAGNLIANPYPCNLDWDLFHADNSSIVDDAYWIYDGNAGNLVLFRFWWGNFK